MKNRGRQIIVLFIVAAWMFILGVLVGRGTAPVHFDMEKLESELASLKDLVVKEERDKFRIDAEPDEPSKELGFYDALKSPEPEPPAPKPKPVKKPPKPAPKPKKAKPVVKKKAETEARKVSSPAAPASRSSKLTIQVAASKDARTADQLIDRLRVKGYPAYRETADLGSRGTWYRVRIGSFETRDDTRGTLRRLKKENFDPIVVPLKP